MKDKAHEILKKLGVDLARFEGTDIQAFTPVDGSLTASLKAYSPEDVLAVIDNAHNAFLSWRSVPAPQRGELIRIFGEVLRRNKDDLAWLVTLEAGKIKSEGLGEVQEMIDICDFAVGLSRQLYGLTIASERPQHHMREAWQPLGVVGVISAFNFPVAVWCWNAALAIVCGNSVIWKPSEKTPLTALATQSLFEKAVELYKAAGHEVPPYLSSVVNGRGDVGAMLTQSLKVALISATGSTRMGKNVAEASARRLGKTLLELGGNNAMIVMPSADLDMAVRAILFGAVGTAGQRCTTLRRLLVHKDVKAQLLPKLIKAYQSLNIGNPFDSLTLIGPLIDAASYEAMQKAISAAIQEGGAVLAGGKRADVKDGGFYVEPAIIEMKAQTPTVCHETFAPILYVMEIDSLEQGIALNNAVTQGLSSCIFTLNVREAELFLSATGSDCGIANVNIGPSGAEIGGAFGGEKDTGGGRESGSDFVEGVYAQANPDGQLFRKIAVGAGRSV